MIQDVIDIHTNKCNIPDSQQKGEKMAVLGSFLTLVGFVGGMNNFYNSETGGQRAFWFSFLALIAGLLVLWVATG